MSNPPVPVELSAAREQFLALVGELRPELHRYCARLVGSAIDGEDVVQEALAKAFYAISLQPELPPLRPWLFRIAHNTAIDFLRRYERRFVEPVAELPETALADAGADPEVVRAALSSFVALPVRQRSAVILKDVLGHSLEEIAAATGATVPAVKAALRARARQPARARAAGLHAVARSARDLARGARAARPLRQPVQRARLGGRQGHAARGVPARPRVQVGAAGQGGRRCTSARYAEEPDLRFVLGRAEGRDVIGVFRGDGATQPAYVILARLRRRSRLAHPRLPLRPVRGATSCASKPHQEGERDMTRPATDGRATKKRETFRMQCGVSINIARVARQDLVAAHRRRGVSALELDGVEHRRARSRSGRRFELRVPIAPKRVFKLEGQRLRAEQAHGVAATARRRCSAACAVA